MFNRWTTVGIWFALIGAFVVFWYLVKAPGGGESRNDAAAYADTTAAQLLSWVDLEAVAKVDVVGGEVRVATTDGKFWRVTDLRVGSLDGGGGGGGGGSPSIGASLWSWLPALALFALLLPILQRRARRNPGATPEIGRAIGALAWDEVQALLRQRRVARVLLPVGTWELELTGGERRRMVNVLLSPQVLAMLRGGGATVDFVDARAVPERHGPTEDAGPVPRDG
jgi:hypothetical protein